jgi:hypothetical protein
MSDEYAGVLVAVAGLIAALVALTWLQQRYQLFRVRIASAVQPLERGALAIEVALQALRRVPLSRELRVLLRAEVLQRLRRIQRLHRGYPGLRERLVDAERSLEGEGTSQGSGIGAIDDEATYQRINAALETLSGIIGRNQLLQPIPFDVRAIFLRQLGERKAELMARYHLVGARRSAAKGNASTARSHVMTLLNALRHQVPQTPFVRALRQEAETLLASLVGQRPAA